VIRTASPVRAFLRDERGAAATEFALVLPVALLFFFGIIDAGRYAWAINRLEKAVQMGTRTAVVTNIVAADLNTADYTGFECPALDADGNPTTRPIKAGDTICAEAVPVVTCNATSCDDGGTFNSDAFNRILGRMRVVDPSLRGDEVTITYSGSGIGYLGDPAKDDDGNDLADAAPVVTVSVNRAMLRMLFLLGGRVPLPDFSYSQTLEDGEGVVSY